MAIKVKTAGELKLMRKSGRVAQRILNRLGEATQAGNTPLQLDALARRLLESSGAKSPFLGKRGHNGAIFPASITVSPNEAVVHGVPSDRAFREGDIISIDCGAIIEGYHGDAAFTMPVGEVEPEALKLIEVTEESLRKGIEQMVDGNRLSDIGHAVQTVAEAGGYSVVREYVGHGIGTAMHEEPQVPNYGPPGKGIKLKVGHVLAVEPMVNLGSARTKLLDDGWTVVTLDGRISAHFEHSIAVTDNGPEVLTVSD